MLRQCGPGVNFIPAYMENTIVVEQDDVDKLFNEILYVDFTFYEVCQVRDGQSLVSYKY